MYTPIANTQATPVQLEFKIFSNEKLRRTQCIETQLRWTKDLQFSPCPRKKNGMNVKSWTGLAQFYIFPHPPQPPLLPRSQPPPTTTTTLYLCRCAGLRWGDSHPDSYRWTTCRHCSRYKSVGTHCPRTGLRLDRTKDTGQMKGKRSRGKCTGKGTEGK